MKKFFVSILITLIAVSCIAFTACDSEDKHSTAVSKYELIRENYAAEKEAEDDAVGREHIEIPADAQTVEIDNEEWVVIRSIVEFERKVSGTGSFILANDIEVRQHKAPNDRYFKGRLNGNNYKFYGTEETGGLYGCLFYRIENAIIENVIFSASDGYYFWHGLHSLANTDVFIAYSAENCILRNCINYFQPKNIFNKRIASFGGFIDRAAYCYIDNCLNYADLIADGGIINTAMGCQIFNCKNYGNIIDDGDVAGGGIVGRAQYDNIIENCVNYGSIIGNRYLGGILGGVYLGLDNPFPYDNGLLNEEYYTELIIKNSINYGNIYMLRSNEDSRLESLDDIDCSDIYAVGGIAGSTAKVENCKNEGNFYGFESLGKGINVNYTGGVVGVAREVVDCSNTGTMVIHKGRAKNVGDIYGYLL